MLLRPAIVVRGGGRFAEVAAGFMGGLTGGATAFPGAIPTLWCNARGLSKIEQRSIVQPFIFVMQIATLVYFSKLGMLASDTMTIYLWCVPAVVAGTWLGLRIFDRIDDARFRRLVLVFLFVSGITLVIVGRIAKLGCCCSDGAAPAPATSNQFERAAAATSTGLSRYSSE
jgi:uncharacterized membrane protein YfcA